MAFHLNSKNNRKRSSGIADINITPFVDVLLVLLIIFMVAAPLMTSNVDLNLPKGTAKTEKQEDRPITVSVDKDGGIFLLDEKTTLKLLGGELTKITTNREDKIFVRADIQINYGQVMEVIKAINQNGFSQVVLVTEVENN